MKRVAALVCCLLALVVGGCATLGDPRGISVSVVQVQPRQASLFETTADLTLRLTNEATEPIAFAGSTHRLFLNGTYVGRAVTNERLTIPQLGTATQTVTVYLENLVLMRKAAELSQSTAPAIGYRLESQFEPASGSRFGGRLRAIATGELDLSAFNFALPTGAVPLNTAGAPSRSP